MAAYCVFNVTVTDRSWLEEYAPKTLELVEKHGGKYIVRDLEPQRLEGSQEVPSGVVVLEFPSVEAAQA